MKWKVKPIKYWNRGDKQTVISFAFFPVRLSDNTKIWFEYYYADRVYCTGDYMISDYWYVEKKYQK